jgi:hypothetical protein
MARTLAELRATTDETLIAEHDAKAPQVEESLNYYLEELARRHQNRQTEAMLGYTEAMLGHTRIIKRLTWAVTGLTVVVTIATLINVWIAADPTILFR